MLPSVESVTVSADDWKPPSGENFTLVVADVAKVLVVLALPGVGSAKNAQLPVPSGFKPRLALHGTGTESV